MDELLALVGRSWQPLLLYPGALASLLLTAVMRVLWWGRRTGVSQGARGPGWTPPAVLMIGCSLLLLAQLPFPRSYWAYPIDVVTGLALLELPHWIRLRRRWRAADPVTRTGATDEAGALLQAYPLLALVVAALGQATGSLLLPDLKTGVTPLRWAALVGWAIILPPLLGLGPWRVAGGHDWIDDLRRVAHIALLVAIVLPAGDQWDHTTSALGAALGCGSVTVLHRLWRGRPEPWERWQPLVALLLLLLLLQATVTAWTTRLR